MTDFPFYRRLCDQENTAFRRLGLLDEARYAAALQDRRTVVVRVGGRAVPALTPIEYAPGYHAPRTRELTSHDPAFLLSVPPALLPAKPAGTPPTGYAVLVESDRHDTAALKAELEQRFPRAVARDFPDPRAGGGSASLIAYTAGFHLNAAPRSGGGEGAALLDAAGLRADPGLVERLWDLYGERFDWLGRHHPVAMEESQATFNAALMHGDTRTLVTFERDRPVCMGVFMTGLAACDWLSPPFRASLEGQAEAERAELIYFYGLASGPEAGPAAAEEVMATFARTVWRSGRPCRLVFEATNLSSRYIPALVAKRAHESPYGGFAPGTAVKALGQVDYWYLDVSP